MMGKFKISGIYTTSNPYICFIVIEELKYQHLIVYKMIFNQISKIRTNSEINTCLSYGSLCSDQVELIINGQLDTNGYLGQINEKSMKRLKNLISQVKLENIEMVE